MANAPQTSKPPSLRQRISAAFRVLTGRASGPALTRSYEAGNKSPHWPVSAMMAQPARQALAQRATISQRAAWLVANAPLGESIVLNWQTNLVGDGPSVRSRHPDESVRGALEDAWNNDFWPVADIEGGDLAQFLARVVRSMVVHGEAFVRLLATRRGELRLQLLNPEQVDASMNAELDGGRRIVAGVELGPNGERLAYHVRPDAPASYMTIAAPPARVPADDICHVFEPKNPGQVRGLSWLTPVATRLLDVDSLEEAGLAKVKTTALLTGFIRNTNMGDVAVDDLAPPAASLEPGTMRYLSPGQEIEFSPTSDMAGLGDFIKFITRTIGAGSGMPYALLTGDLSDTNYSSGKLGLEAFRRRCIALRSSLLGTRLLDRVWARFVTLEVLSGRLSARSFERDRALYYRASFFWPAWSSLEPFREARAEDLALRNGTRSREEIIASRGRDPRDVDREIDPLQMAMIQASIRGSPASSTATVEGETGDA